MPCEKVLSGETVVTRNMVRLLYTPPHKEHHLEAGRRGTLTTKNRLGVRAACRGVYGFYTSRTSCFYVQTVVSPTSQLLYYLQYSVAVRMCKYRGVEKKNDPVVEPFP